MFCSEIKKNDKGHICDVGLSEINLENTEYTVIKNVCR